MNSPRTIELPSNLAVVNPMTSAEVCDWIAEPRTTEHGPIVLGNLNLHGLYLSVVDATFERFLERSDVIIIDGWPILQLARMGAPRGAGLDGSHRTGSTDWLQELIDRDPDLLVVAVGGSAETASKSAGFVADRTETMRWLAFDGFDFESRGSIRVGANSLDEALASADLVLVGLGMPLQERWILESLAKMSPGCIVANVGGCLDYLAGTQRLAPRWLGKAGLEWAYRLALSPRRLAGRYLIEPMKLAWIVATGRVDRTRSLRASADAER